MKPMILIAVHLAAILLLVGCSGDSGSAEKPLPIRAHQVEAKMVLRQILAMQRAYHHAHNQYWGQGVTASASKPQAFSQLGVEIPVSSTYAYAITTASASEFTATATATFAGTADTWSIDQTGRLTNP